MMNQPRSWATLSVDDARFIPAVLNEEVRATRLIVARNVPEEKTAERRVLPCTCTSVSSQESFVVFFDTENNEFIAQNLRFARICTVGFQPFRFLNEDSSFHFASFTSSQVQVFDRDGKHKDALPAREDPSCEPNFACLNRGEIYRFVFGAPHPATGPC
jgi:hypothetical protein